MIDLLFALFDKPYEPLIAVSAAYAIHAGIDSPATECCGECEGGKIVHGDGHVTDCPCPEGCECKREAAVVHPSIVISPQNNEPPLTTRPCPDGRCRVR